MALRTIFITIILLHHHLLDISSATSEIIESSHRLLENVTSHDELEQYDSNRNGRTFFGDLTTYLRPSIFNIVRFPNEECLDASNQSGTCYTALECKKLGGNPSSKCARGLGTCCIMSRTCHNSTANKVVYFRNPSYPLTDAGQNFCDLTVNIVDPDVCQLRIDFLEFQIDPPISGDCVGDKFTVTASGMTPTSVPVLCGNNRNQHIYVTLPANTVERSVSIVFETNASGDYRFHLRVTQIDCRIRQPSVTTSSSTAVNPLNPLGFPSVSQVNLRRKRHIYQKIPNQLTFPAPTGCLQYYTASSGTIESFNFGNYLNNLDYAICIERQPDTCRVIFTSTDANFGIKAGGTVTNQMPGVGDVDCASDYLMLSGGSQTGEGQTKDRYCGGVLAYSNLVAVTTPVISKANGPIVIRFHSDETPALDLKEGFRVKYEQSPTDCAVLNSGTVNQQNLNLLNPNFILPNPLVMALEAPPTVTVKIPIQKSSTPISPENEEKESVKARNNGKMLAF